MATTKTRENNTMGLSGDSSDNGQREEAAMLDGSSSRNELGDEPNTASKNTRTHKRKADGSKQVALKRFKTNPNDKATKNLMADTLFGCTDVVSVIFSFFTLFWHSKTSDFQQSAA